MTLAFTFKIKDAWIIIADKGVVSKLDSTDDRRNSARDKITIFSDNEIKIKNLKYNLFFVGSGEQEYLDKIVKVINDSDNFLDFKDHLHTKMAEVYGGFNSSVPKNEEFLIIDKKSQKAFKIDTRLIEKDGDEKGVYPLDIINLENNFIGSFKQNARIGYVKIKITSLKNIPFDKVKREFNDICNDMLSLLSMDYPNLIGHPSIQGSNIWIISKTKIKKVFTFPKNNYNYKYKAK